MRGDLVAQITFTQGEQFAPCHYAEVIVDCSGPSGAVTASQRRELLCFSLWRKNGRRVASR